MSSTQVNSQNMKLEVVVLPVSDVDRSNVVDAILYLESANFVTGEILHIDGGQSAGH